MLMSFSYDNMTNLTLEEGRNILDSISNFLYWSNNVKHSGILIWTQQEITQAYFKT